MMAEQSTIWKMHLQREATMPYRQTEMEILRPVLVRADQPTDAYGSTDRTTGHLVPEELRPWHSASSSVIGSVEMLLPAPSSSPAAAAANAAAPTAVRNRLR